MKNDLDVRTVGIVVDGSVPEDARALGHLLLHAGLSRRTQVDTHLE
jgi:hypothetical protein